MSTMFSRVQNSWKIGETTKRWPSIKVKWFLYWIVAGSNVVFLCWCNQLPFQCFTFHILCKETFSTGNHLHQSCATLPLLMNKLIQPTWKLTVIKTPKRHLTNSKTVKHRAPVVAWLNHRTFPLTAIYQRFSMS